MTQILTYTVDIDILNWLLFPSIEQIVLVDERQGELGHIRMLISSHKLASTICAIALNVFLLWPNLMISWDSGPGFPPMSLLFFSFPCVFMKYISNPIKSQVKELEQITAEFARFTLTNSGLSSPRRSQQLSGQLLTKNTGYCPRNVIESTNTKNTANESSSVTQISYVKNSPSLKYTVHLKSIHSASLSPHFMLHPDS